MTKPSELNLRLAELFFVVCLAFDLFKYENIKTRNVNLRKLTRSQLNTINKSVEEWLLTPNDAFFKDYPLQACFSGDLGVVSEWLKERLGVNLNQSSKSNFLEEHDFLKDFTVSVSNKLAKRLAK